ncbi:MAG: thiamine phosphate synthase [Muribaculaceae bacterium]|nr:thiamine phosphate synthase [Muribaculaceae bacterium]
MLQYITNPNSTTPIVDQVKQVIEGGCRWVQLCHKQASDDEIKDLVAQLKPICSHAETVLLLHSRVELAKELELDGVFLEKGDMPPTQARDILGGGPIIGVTVNSADQIGQIRYFDIDYIAFGPYNADNAVCLDDYSKAMQYIHENHIEIPVVAIGNITPSDAKPLMQAGVNGLAVSEAIADSDNLATTTAQFITLLDTPNRIG